MEPGLSPDQMAARVTRLRQEADRAMAALQNRMEAVRSMRERTEGTTGEARSGDGRIRAVVDATGVVTSLTFAPSSFDDTTPERLATTVVATIQAAAAKARTRVSDAVTTLRGDDTTDVPPGMPDLRELRVGVPEAPVTAMDPTVRRDEWGSSPDPTPPDATRDDEFSERPW